MDPWIPTTSAGVRNFQWCLILHHNIHLPLLYGDRSHSLGFAMCNRTTVCLFIKELLTVVSFSWRCIPTSEPDIKNQLGALHNQKCSSRHPPPPLLLYLNMCFVLWCRSESKYTQQLGPAFLPHFLLCSVSLYFSVTLAFQPQNLMS